MRINCHGRGWGSGGPRRLARALEEEPSLLLSHSTFSKVSRWGQRASSRRARLPDSGTVRRPPHFPSARRTPDAGRDQSPAARIGATGEPPTAAPPARPPADAPASPPPTPHARRPALQPRGRLPGARSAPGTPPHTHRAQVTKAEAGRRSGSGPGGGGRRGPGPRGWGMGCGGQFHPPTLNAAVVASTSAGPPRPAPRRPRRPGTGATGSVAPGHSSHPNPAAKPQNPAGREKRAPVLVPPPQAPSPAHLLVEGVDGVHVRAAAADGGGGCSGPPPVT